MSRNNWPYDDDSDRQLLDDEQSLAEANEWKVINDRMRQLTDIRRENVELIETLSRSVTLLNNSIDEAIALCEKIDAFMAEIRAMSVSRINPIKTRENT